MTLYNVAVVIIGTDGVLLTLFGFWLMLRPHRAWKSWYEFERRWRLQRFGGGWSKLEHSMRRRGYFWVPKDIDLSSPDDVYAYAFSDRFWRSGYGWFMRALMWYAGLLLVFFGFLFLAIGISVP